MSLETLSKAMSNFGISAHQATKAVEELAAHIPPFTEDDSNSFGMCDRSFYRMQQCEKNYDSR